MKIIPTANQENKEQTNTVACQSESHSESPAIFLLKIFSNEKANTTPKIYPFNKCRKVPIPNLCVSSFYGISYKKGYLIINFFQFLLFFSHVYRIYYIKFVSKLQF